MGKFPDAFKLKNELVFRDYAASEREHERLVDWYAERKFEEAGEEFEGDRTVAGRALAAISVPCGMGLEQAEKVRRQQRRYRIVRDFLEATDKDAVVEELGEKWGLTERGVRLIVADGMRRGRLAAEFAAKREALCLIKKQQIFSDGQLAREEIYRQIDEAMESEADWLAVETTEDDSEKGGTKTKLLPKNKVLLHLYSKLQETYVKETAALDQYMEKPPKENRHSGRVEYEIIARQEFRDQFEKIRRLELKEVEHGPESPGV